MLITAASTAAYVSRLKATRDPSAHTLKAYASDLKDYRRFIADRDLCPTQTDTLVAYARHLMVERAVAPRTVRRRMACLRGFYKDLVRATTIAQSPFVGLEMQLPRPRSLPRAVNRADARKLVEHAWRICGDRRTSLGDKAFPVAVLLLVSVGLRVGELVQLRPGSFDLETGGLDVAGKGRRERRVFVVDNRLRQIVAKLAARRGATVLLSADGGAWSTQVARRQLRAFAAAAGLEKRLHSPHVAPHLRDPAPRRRRGFALSPEATGP